MDASTESLNQIKPDLKWIVTAGFRAGTYAARDRLLVHRVTDPAVVPPRPESITREWLCGALGQKVRDFEYLPVSSGTSERGRLLLDYAQGSKGPATVFVKSAATFKTRLTNSPVAEFEATFYRDLRPDLGDAEVPQGIYSATDPVTWRAIHLIEDLARDNPQIVFPDVSTILTRVQAENAVVLLARLHRTFAGRIDGRGLRTYRQWWESTLSIANVRAAMNRFAQSDLCPPSLSADDLWRAGLDSVAVHRMLPPTLLHGDPHLANWYLIDDRAGLLDWQCVSAGHFSRDLAYAMTTLLTIDQRHEWEHDLLALYLQESGFALRFGELVDHYRSQIVGALMMWAPTLFPPKGFPAMQPEALARELTGRIATAMVDLETVE
ncbi:phosphotransferase family protein [Jongsikchunia kroppenstedtii]|uniref:phosphotransferase family protein n=1 Tax=Jongsikchunia kroppenstedtii TaxID=1121721 RepID=UPI00037983B5|nr:aminoglycoside phosphotransferase family protein [Jongsikchunia kroppenstedtii]